MANEQREPGGYGDKFRLLQTIGSDQRADRSDIAVLGVLLRRFNRAHGCCWPAIASIAADAAVSNRTVHRAIRRLDEWGYIHMVKKPGKLIRFVPHFQAQNSLERGDTRVRGSKGSKGCHLGPEGVPSESQRGATQRQKGVTQVAPESLKESIKESEKEKGDDNGNGFFSSEVNQETEKQKQERIREDIRTEYLDHLKNGNSKRIKLFESEYPFRKHIEDLIPQEALHG